MSKGLQVAIACAVLLAAAVWSGPINPALAAQSEPTAAPAKPSGDYKVGVVDMDEVVKNYKVLKTQLDALQAEKDKKQKDLDAKTDALSKKMEEVKNAPEGDREQRSSEISSELRKLKADMQSMQDELNDKAAKLRFRTRQDIIKAIQEIGAKEDYHLILEGDTDGTSTVIYFAGPMNITGKVIEKLNAGAPSEPAAAAAPAAPKKK